MSSPLETDGGDGPPGTGNARAGSGRSQRVSTTLMRPGGGPTGSARTRLDGQPWIGTLFRLVLAGVLFWAGLVKLFETENVAGDAILAYRLGMGRDLANLLGRALPAVEILLAVLLLIGLFTRWAALATGLLMLGFMVGIAQVWARGYSIDCGCFGGGGDVSEVGKTGRYLAELFRDFLFVGMSTWLVAWPRTALSLDAWRSPHQPADLYRDDDPESELI